MKGKNKITMRPLLMCIILIGMGTACQKAAMIDYQAGPGAYFYGLLSDSTNYSFANNVGILEQDTLLLEMQIMGDLTDYEREIQLVATKGSTATEGVHYKLPAVKIPANTYNFNYPVILYNTPDLKTKTVRLELTIAPNKDFVNGSGMITNSRLYNLYKINFNNRLIKPDYWLYIQNYFGEYSDVKYRFMIDVLGISNLMPDYIGGTIIYSDFINYAGTMSRALEVYEAQYGPKLDENGKEISFPL